MKKLSKAEIEAAELKAELEKRKQELAFLSKKNKPKAKATKKVEKPKA